jgi:hypothetical protein
VSTNVWLVERATGGFESLTAGVAAPGEAVVSATARVQRQWQQDDGGREAPLPIVVISDGAKTMRCQLAERFAQPGPVIVDWDPLEKQVGEVRSMVARNTQEKEGHVAHLLRHLWHGHTAVALADLRREVQANNPQQLAA